MTADFHRTAMRPRPKTSSITGENRYWSHFKNPVNVKHYNKITDIEFSPLAPYDFAVTSSTRVQIYDSNTCSVKKSLSRFPDVAYSGSYRGSDGKVLVAGCEDSKIRVYDLSSRVVLRTLVGHTAPVKTVRFLSEQRFLLSGSDDHSVRTWDMTTEQNLDVLRGHTDYVRSVVEHTDFNPFCFLSAAYDHTVRYWDRRLSNAQGQACVFTLNHGAPIEDLLVLPNHGQGDLLATAGENTVKIWNIRMASNSAAAASAAAASSSQRGALLHRSSNHQKTVLSLTYDHSTDRMLSGGLDHMVKIYDMRPSLTGGALDSSTPRSSLATEFMSVTHSMKFAAPILSTAISPDSRVLVVGMADGSLSMRTRDISGVNKAASFLPPKNLAESLREDVAYSTPLPPARSEPRPGSRRFFGRGASFEPGKGLPSADDDAEATGEDLKIARVRRQRLAPYDVLLKGFKYHAALDAALATNRPTIVLSMLDELINRNGLVHALANRDAHALLPLMHFASKYLAHPAYAATLVDLVNLVLDLYAPLLGLVVEFDALLYRLAQRVLKPELENQKALIALQAVLSNVTARSALRQRQLDQAEPEEEEEEQPMQQQDTDERMHDTAAAAGEEEEEQQEGEEDEQPAAAAEEEEEEEEEAEEEEPTPAQTKSSSKPSKRKQPPTVTSAADLDAEEAVEEEEDAEQPGSPPPKGKNKKKDKENKQVQEEEEDEPAPAEEEEEEEEQPQTKAKKHKKAHKDAAASPALAPANGKPAKKQKV